MIKQHIAREENQMTEIIYSHDYKGQRWTYGLSYRPVGGSNLPQGDILFSERDHAEFKFGTVDYPRELTEDEVTNFQLTLVTA